VTTSGRPEILLRKNVARRKPLMFLNRSRRIRIIYIIEEIQVVTLCCCLLWLSGRAGRNQKINLTNYFNDLAADTGFQYV